MGLVVARLSTLHTHSCDICVPSFSPDLSVSRLQVPHDPEALLNLHSKLDNWIYPGNQLKNDMYSGFTFSFDYFVVFFLSL